MRDDLLHLKYLHSALRFALPHRNAILLILLLTVLMAAANAAEPLVLKYIFDDLAKQAAWKVIAQGLMLLAALAVLREVARGISDWLQDPLLFNDSIRANISYSRPTASMAEIEAAARAANAHDLIMRLPEGYNSLVGERGGLLSAGGASRSRELC